MQISWNAPGNFCAAASHACHQAAVAGDWASVRRGSHREGCSMRLQHEAAAFLRASRIGRVCGRSQGL